jgi:hypothetical protein
MLFVLIPHEARDVEDFRFFLNFPSAEQVILRAAQGFEHEGRNPDWCYLIAYDGTDELLPVFLYTLVGSVHLHRQPYPSPSP